MAKRHRKGKRGVSRTTSVLTAIFAITPALYVLTNYPSGFNTSPLNALLGGGGSWQSIATAASALAQNVVQNWITILILLAVVFVAIKVVRKIGRGAHITRHLTA